MFKSSKFWSLVIVAWLSAVSASAGIITPKDLPVFVFLAIFWLYGIFNTGVVIFSHFVKPMRPSKLNPHMPKVAILYCCYNDFNERSLQSILDLSYRNREIYILDDSTDKKVRKDVDEFAKVHGLKVFRRASRRGWKAGAVNDAIKKIKADYFLIADSDEILAKDFIEKTLGYFADPKVAFVQANHICYNKDDNRWTRCLGVGVDLHWDHYQEYRNRYGLVPILGHGVMIRADLLKRFGFPEMVSEDLALTMELARHGYRGVFAKDVVCGEAFPPSYLAFRKRHKKWSQGTVEILRKALLPFILDRNVRWFEKLDTILPLMNLPLAASFPIFIILSTILNPKFFYHPLVIGMSIITIIGPMLIFHDLKGSLLQRVETILMNTLAYGSLFGVSIIYIMKGIISPTFLVTGSKERRSFDFTLIADCIMASALNMMSFPNFLGFFLLTSPLLWRLYR